MVIRHIRASARWTGFKLADGTSEARPKPRSHLAAMIALAVGSMMPLARIRQWPDLQALDGAWGLCGACQSTGVCGWRAARRRRRGWVFTSVRSRRRPVKAPNAGGLGGARMATWAPSHVRVSGTCMAVILADRPASLAAEHRGSYRPVEAHATEGNVCAAIAACATNGAQLSSPAAVPCGLVRFVCHSERLIRSLPVAHRTESHVRSRPSQNSCGRTDHRDPPRCNRPRCAALRPFCQRGAGAGTS